MTNTIWDYDDADLVYEDLYGNVDFTLKETIGDEIAGHEKLKQKMDNWTVSQFKQRLQLIHPKLYSDKHRILFFLLQQRLSEKGVAPYWRGMVRTRGTHKKGSKPLSEMEQRYANDCQMVDMEWGHRQYRGHRVNGRWMQLYKGITTGDSFNYQQSNIIACSKFTKAEKIKNMRLNDVMQSELFMLTTDSVRKKQVTIEKQLEEVENDLIQAAHANPRRGQKLLDNIESRLIIWQCIKLSKSNSPSLRCALYKKITGEPMTLSTFNGKMKSLNAALIEIGSQHAFKP